MIADTLTSGFSSALALTLLHSLWQGLVIFTLTAFSLSLISKINSTARYLIATGGLLLFAVVALVTFLMNLPTTESVNSLPALITYYSSNDIVDQRVEWTSQILHFVNGRSGLISAVWLAGTLCFLSRTVMGWAYLTKIVAQGQQAEDLWYERIQEIATSLGINRTVRLIESSLVNSPVVIGIIKPAIVIPIGLASGLTVQQVEAIFVHELVHIRRHDYLINMMQCVVESVFFFNPFIWMLSRAIRKEREHCCDDAVIAHGTNPRCYVMALATLEESRIAGNAIALSVSGNKNELLNRIKRLMEKSVQKYSLRDRMIPVALLLVGFICASWFTIQRGYEPSPVNESTLMASDTTKKNKKNRMKRVDETREQEKNDETFSQQEHVDLFAPPPSADMIPDIPPFDIPDVDFDIPEFNVDIPDFNTEEFTTNMHLFMHDFDSLPPFGRRDWGAFEEEFRTKFQEKFKDFYNKNEKEIEQMLDELEKNQLSFLNESRLAELHARAEASHRLMEDHQDRLMEQQMHLQDMEFKMKEWEENHARQMQRMEQNMKEFERKMKEFDAAVKEELVKDGYLKKDESIHSFQWSDHGSIEINGKPIRKEHENKYREIHKKHIPKMKGTFQYTE